MPKNDKKTKQEEVEDNAKWLEDQINKEYNFPNTKSNPFPDTAYGYRNRRWRGGHCHCHCRCQCRPCDYIPYRGPGDFPPPAYPIWC